MQKVRISWVWLAGSTLLLLVCSSCKADYVLRVGNRVSGDKLIQREEFELSKFEGKQFDRMRTYTGDNISRITQLVVTDQKEGDMPMVALVHGGPGYTFATFRFEFSRIWNKLLVLEMYGKPADAAPDAAPDAA